MKKKNIVICSILIALGIFGIIKVSNHLDNDYIVVPGTVYGKNEASKSQYKSNVVSSMFWVAIHPDDSTKYKDYDVSVKYSTFAKLKLGSHTQFSVLRNKVERNYDGHYNLFVFLFFALCVFEFVAVIYLIWLSLD